MILWWLLVWLIFGTPHIIVLPLDRMNAWGLTLILAGAITLARGHESS